MKYKYRWLYALTLSIVFIALGYVYDIQPDLFKVSQLRKKETHLKIKITNIPKENTKVAALKHKKDFLSDLWVLLYQSGLKIKTVHFSRIESSIFADVENMHLVMEGNFQQFYNFIFALNQLAYTALLTNFSCKTIQNLLKIEINLLLFKHVPSKNHPYQFLPNIHNPFCFAGGMMIENNFDKLRSVSLKQLKMAGYMQQGNHQEALIRLPSGRVVEVKPGFTIGKEGGLVTDICSDRIILMLAEKKRFVMKLS